MEIFKIRPLEFREGSKLVGTATELLARVISYPLMEQDVQFYYELRSADGTVLKAKNINVEKKENDKSLLKSLAKAIDVELDN